MCESDVIFMIINDMMMIFFISSINEDFLQQYQIINT